MSGGELAVKTGNDGERMMKEFLKLIGWSNLSQNVTFLCSLGLKHKIKKSKSEKEDHNIDATFYYDSPLNHDDTDIILCSSKHNQERYTDSNKAYSYLKELAYSLECSLKDINFASKFENGEIKKKVFKGLLFWVSSNRDEHDYNMIGKISDGLINEDEEKTENTIGKLKGINFDSIYLVDNRKATFIYSAIKTAQINNPLAIVQFLYPHTGLNNKT